MTTLNENIDDLLLDMADRLNEYLESGGRKEPLMVGIHTGGVWVAQRLHELLKLSEPLGHLSINFYRDDFSRIGLHPRVEPSQLPVSPEDRHLILVDDVLHTGRTVRAALNELFDYGRPASVCLAVLVDRSGRELPIEADIVGKYLQLTPHQHVKLVGPSPLQLVMKN